MSTLKDQLLKAGLASPPAKKQPKAKAPTPPKKSRRKVGESTLRAQRAMLDKAKKDKALNVKRLQEAERKERYAQIKQLVDGSKLDRKEGENAYNFTHNKKVKTVYVTQQQHKQLSDGELSIVVMDGGSYELVPNKVADRIAQRESHRVVQNKLCADLPAVDDPYADYQIPDDLSW